MLKLRTQKIHYLIFISIPLYFLIDRVNKLEIEFPVIEGLKIFAQYFLISIIAFFFFKKKLSKINAIIITAIFLFFYLFFGVIVEKISSIKMLFFLNRPLFHYPLIIILFITVILFFLKLRKRSNEKILMYINTLFLLFLSIEGVKYMSRAKDYEKNKITTEPIHFKTVKKRETPNIYFFVLDEYAGTTSLKEYFNYDNIPFIDELKKRGFYVVKNPNSNYNLTWASMASTFDMGYFIDFKEEDFIKENIYIRLSEIINKNKLLTFLESNNYTIYNNSFFEFYESGKKTHSFSKLIESKLTSHTFLSKIKKGPLNHIPSNYIQLKINTFFANRYKYNKEMIDKSKKIIDSENNKFMMYSHFMMPHPPFVMEKNGRIKNLSIAYKEMSNQKKVIKGYIDYLSYTNEILLNLINAIIEKNENSIIILSSDHGYRWHLNKSRPENDFNNFIAIYNFEKNYKGFTDSISNVNLFRLILNNHFDQNLPLLNNKRFNVRKGHL